MALLIDSETGEPWSLESRRAAHRQMRKQAIADLRARDERRNANVPTYKLGSSNKYVPDEEVVALKHTAQETDDLLRYRWHQFGSKPQSETEFLARSTQQKARAIDPALERAGKAVERSLTESVERSLTESEERAPKRRPKAKSKA